MIIYDISKTELIIGYIKNTIDKVTPHPPFYPLTLFVLPPLIAKNLIFIFYEYCTYNYL